TMSGVGAKPCAGGDVVDAVRCGEGAARVVTSIHWYFCVAPQPGPTRSSCAVCGRTLQMPPPLLTLGRAYLLNRLDDLIGAVALDEASADRIRTIITKELEAGAVRPAIAAAMPVARPSSADGRAAVPLEAAPPRISA